MIHTEDILFMMPRDAEMQFPAMSALQMYVNHYKVKMEANCVLPEMPVFRFRYWAEMGDADWDLFARMGIDLKQPREPIGPPDAVVELNDERLLSFYSSSKHCAQICAAITGVEAPPYPAVRQVAMGKWSRVLCMLDDADALSVPGALHRSVVIEDLLDGTGVDDEPRTMPIVVGRQSWQTYAAAALGYPLIEILPAERGINWLSKWRSPVYRLIEQPHVGARMADAVRNLAEVMEWHSSRAAQGAGVAGGTATAAGASPVRPAIST